MKYIYHFCARHQKRPGEETFSDGIACLEKNIDSPEQYEWLKQEIDKENAHRMTITSLTLLDIKEGE